MFKKNVLLQQRKIKLRNLNMDKKNLTAEDCKKLSKQNVNNSKESKMWKLLSKMAIKQQDKEIRDEQEKQETLKNFTDEGKST